MNSPGEAPTNRKSRWYAPTAAKFLAAVLLMQGVLFLSGQYRWFWFNERKGFTVLIAVTATAACLILLLALCVAVSRYLKTKAQFGLATLLLMVVVMAIPCGWLAREMELARQQAAIVNGFLEPGPGVVCCSGYPHAPTVRFTALSKSQALVQPNGRDWLVSLFGQDFFADVCWVHLWQADDSDLVKLKSLTRLELITLPNTQVTDRGLAALKELKNLQRVQLDRTLVSDVGLEHLKMLPRLEALHVQETLVTEVGAASFREASPDCDIIR